MSFMYKASMARAPNKRKIKLNEQNLMQLMNNSDGDDEEDEDYTISKDKKSDVEDDEEGDESSEDLEEENIVSDNKSDESDDDKNKPCTSRSIRQTRTRRRTLNAASVTVGEVTEKVKSKYYGMANSAQDILLQAKRHLAVSEQVVNSMTNLPDSVCSICLNESNSSKPVPLMTCRICAVSVHQSCYNMDLIENTKRSNDNWICDACIYGGSDVVCQFCPNLFGCMKETKCGCWVHVLCARSILSNFLSTARPSSRRDVSNSSSLYIQLEELNKKQYGAKECLLCDDRLVAKTGICVKCDAGLCKSSIHVTCAQKHGLLSRPKSDPYCREMDIVNCPLHCVEDQMKKKQRFFVIERKTRLVMKRKQSDESWGVKESIYSKLRELRKKKEHSRNTIRNVAPPLEQVPRLLSSDAHFTKLLNHKAEKMYGINTKYPAMIIPKSTEIRKRHNVAPSLTTDFAAYFLDRELRIEEEKEYLSTSLKINESLLESQNHEKKRYNKVRERLIAAKTVKDDLKKEYDNFKLMLSAIMDTLKSKQSSQKGARKRKSVTPKKMTSPKHMTSPTSPIPCKDPIPDADSIIGLKRCGVCDGQDDQHLLVKCDVCLKWQHLGCLDPPLTQMPKRTKFALWQCSECANSSSSSSSDSEIQNRGSFICTDGRRATRRVRRVPEKLAIGFPDREMKREMVGHSRLIHQHQRKVREALENLAKQQKFSHNKSDSVAPSSKNDSQSGSNSSNNITDDSSSSKLSLGLSCDNYLSVAARMPIINQRESFEQSTASPKNLRRIIILKKAFPISSRSRPAGLGQTKQLVAKKKANADIPQVLKGDARPGIKATEISNAATVSDQTKNVVPQTIITKSVAKPVKMNNIKATCHKSIAIQKIASLVNKTGEPSSENNQTLLPFPIVKDTLSVPQPVVERVATSTQSQNLPNFTGKRKIVITKNDQNCKMQKIATLSAIARKQPLGGAVSPYQVKTVITSEGGSVSASGGIKKTVLSGQNKILYKFSTAARKSISAKMLANGILVSKEGKSFQIPSSKYGSVTIKRKNPVSFRVAPSTSSQTFTSMTVGQYMRSSTLKEARDLAIISHQEKETNSSAGQQPAATDSVKKKDLNEINTMKKCSVCDDTKNQACIVLCSTCKKYYHWECCDPPLRANPVSRFAVWECSNCVDKNEVSESQETPEDDIKSGTTITPEGRRVTSRKRKPPDLFDPAFNISNQQKIFKSFAKQRKKLGSTTSTTGSTTRTDLPPLVTAARCRPVPLRYMQCNRITPQMAATRVFNLNGLKLSRLGSVSLVQKQTGPKTSFFSFVPRTNANMPSSSNINLEN